jgi:predicted lipoprotein with Yx(FWY)xxD motif
MRVRGIAWRAAKIPRIILYKQEHGINFMTSLVAMVSLLPSLCGADQMLLPTNPMPPGIGIRVTLDGPVFVDAKGMTLYKVSSPEDLKSCDDRRHAEIQFDSLEGGVDFPVTTSDADTGRTCVQKHPPLRALEDAKPIGKWSIRRRDDGSKQWAYDGEPLYTSIKDRAPGEINGNYSPTGFWTLASAPLDDAPAGITTERTAAGLALARHATGGTLYYPDRKETEAQSKLWVPLAAPVLATADKLGDWSVVTRADGSKQWAFKGRPLYTYAHDSERTAPGNFGDIFGGAYGGAVEGWRVAFLTQAPSHPSEVAIHALVQNSLSFTQIVKRIYTDAKGMTLYTVHCVDHTDDHLDCDDVGDNPRYWLSFCGGEERCAKTWRPLPAPAGAKSIDEVWSVTVINPRHPWQPLDKGAEGVRVWAYRGRPVFTYANDWRVGDYNGATAVEGDTPREMFAQVIRAYEPITARE